MLSLRLECVEDVAFVVGVDERENAAAATCTDQFGTECTGGLGGDAGLVQGGSRYPDALKILLIVGEQCA